MTFMQPAAPWVRKTAEIGWRRMSEVEARGEDVRKRRRAPGGEESKEKRRSQTRYGVLSSSVGALTDLGLTAFSVWANGDGWATRELEQKPLAWHETA